MLPPPHMALALYLTGLFAQDLQVFSFSIPRGSSLTKLVPLDIATDSFDDQYSGCVDMMEEKVGVLHHTEVASTTYAKVWENATTKWNEIQASVSIPKGLKPEYAIAILAYTQKEASLYRDLNKAVRKAGTSENYYFKNFHFKAFHFLLTRALQVLQSDSNSKCYETYRGIKGTRVMVEPSKKVRFGHFASSSLNKAEAMKFGQDTFFTIKTSHGSYIKTFSFFPEEEEVLIPPFERFQVTDFIEKPDGIHIHLFSIGTFSKYNCVYTKGNHKDTWLPGLENSGAQVRLLGEARAPLHINLSNPDQGIWKNH